MSTFYNEIAGQSAKRLAALSDGIFAAAMTLLVLDLRSPAAEVVHHPHDLWPQSARQGRINSRSP